MIFNFNQYSMNESESSKIQDILEDLVQEDFIKEMFGRQEFGYGEDYELDDDTQRGPDGLEKVVWIEIFNAPQETIDALEKDYKPFLEKFSAWLKGKKLGNMYPDVTTPSPNDKNSIIFQVSE